MKKTIAFILVSLLIAIGCKETKKIEAAKDVSDARGVNVRDSISSKFEIEILDDAALEIIDPTSTIEILASGFEWTEGPLWVEDGNYLLFSDIPNNKVYKLNAQNDTITYLHPSGLSEGDFTGAEPGSNGLLLNQKGELVLMQHGNRQVAKMNAPLSDPASAFITLADTYESKKFNSPNDGCFDKDGNLYFTDPPYGLPKQMEDPKKELEYQGVYCLLKSDEVKLVDTLSRPNGIGLSPDGTSLYIAVSDPEHAVWYKYDIQEPGIVSRKQLFADVTHLIGMAGEQGLPDGLKVNRNGILFATGPGGVWIFDQEGKTLARIRTGQKTANCAFGKNEKRLFMTADDYVLAVNLR